MKRCLMSLFLAIATVAQSQQYMNRSWMNTQWTSDDAAYRSARLSIFADLKNKKKLDGTLTKARAELDGKTPTRLGLFQWACAALARSRDDFDFWRKFDNTYELKKPYETLFPKLADTKSYEFTRIRFLFTVTFDFPHTLMSDIGEKLLEKDPKDVSVILALLKIYQPQVSTSDLRKGDRLVKILDEIAPHEFRVLSTTGYYYYLRWMGTKSKSDALESIRRSGLVKERSNSKEQKQIIDRTNSEIRKGTKGLG